MFDSSVIKQTGQWWKLIVSFCGLLLGAGVIFLADHCRRQWGAELWGSRVAEEVPIGRPAAITLALAVIWVPFLFCALLSGDKQVWRYILMLPGAVPAVIMNAHAGEVTCYIASALINLVVFTIAVPLARRGPRVFKLALGLILFAFCVMAFLTWLMLRA